MQDQTHTDSAATHPAIHDCWNKIGVRGDASCSELVQFVHCRNCPVYSAAAVKLLDAERPPGYLSEWTSHFAREKPETERETHSALIFRIGIEWFALSTLTLNEVSELKPLHSLPHRRNRIVLGLVNIRGELLICVSLSEALGLKNKPENEATSPRALHPYLLVVSQEKSRLVFRVDEVIGIHHFSLKAIKAAPETVAGAISTHTKGILPWNNKSVGLLDDQLLFRTLNRSLS